MEKLSILMNSYNRHDIVGHAIDSILNSNMPENLELELVIIDDHSNERTWKVLEGYMKDPRINIHRNEKNVGSGSLNWNKSFKMATGGVPRLTCQPCRWDWGESTANT